MAETKVIEIQARVSGGIMMPLTEVGRTRDGSIFIIVTVSVPCPKMCLFGATHLIAFWNIPQI